MEQQMTNHENNGHSPYDTDQEEELALWDEAEFEEPAPEDDEIKAAYLFNVQMGQNDYALPEGENW
jgi:hypothetical protein